MSKTVSYLKQKIRRCTNPFYKKNLQKVLDHVLKLEEIIKDNFDYSNILGVYFKYDSPVMKEEIKEVLCNEN